MKLFPLKRNPSISGSTFCTFRTFRTFRTFSTYKFLNGVNPLTMDMLKSHALEYGADYIPEIPKIDVVQFAPTIIASNKELKKIIEIALKEYDDSPEQVELTAGLNLGIVTLQVTVRNKQ